jgi:hypothetical protein
MTILMIESKILFSLFSGYTIFHWLLLVVICVASGVAIWLFMRSYDRSDKQVQKKESGKTAGSKKINKVIWLEGKDKNEIEPMLSSFLMKYYQAGKYPGLYLMQVANQEFIVRFPPETGFDELCYFIHHINEHQKNAKENKVIGWIDLSTFKLQKFEGYQQLANLQSSKAILYTQEGNQNAVSGYLASLTTENNISFNIDSYMKINKSEGPFTKYIKPFSNILSAF